MVIPAHRKDPWLGRQITSSVTDAILAVDGGRSQELVLDPGPVDAPLHFRALLTRQLVNGHLTGRLVDILLTGIAR